MLLYRVWVLFWVPILRTGYHSQSGILISLSMSFHAIEIHKIPSEHKFTSFCLLSSEIPLWQQFYNPDAILFINLNFYYLNVLFYEHIFNWADLYFAESLILEHLFYCRNLFCYPNEIPLALHVQMIEVSLRLILLVKLSSSHVSFKMAKKMLNLIHIYSLSSHTLIYSIYST